MARVERAVTTTTVRMVSRSLSLPRGRTEAIARAADAPQIPTAPPDNRPKARDWPSLLDTRTPKAMVVPTPKKTVTIGMTPRPRIWEAVMRAPSSATPSRSTALEENSMPATQRPSSCRKWKAMPSRRENSITGAV